MSESIPPRHQSAKKPYYKIRPGFTNEELAEYFEFLKDFDLEAGKFARGTLLKEIRNRRAQVQQGAAS